MSIPARDASFERAATMVRWLDDRWLDPVTGLLFPGMGDVLSAGAGLYIVGLGIRAKLPPIVLARMLVNLAADAALGAIPVAGDVFDFLLKANKRNLALLESRHVTRHATAGDWIVVGLAGLAFVAALLLPLILLITVLSLLF